MGREGARGGSFLGWRMFLMGMEGWMGWEKGKT